MRSADTPFVRSAARTDLDLHLRVNGRSHRIRAEARETLLDVLRERLGLFGTKKGCDHGQCGACTVLVDGRRVLSCLTLAAQAEHGAVTTVEGMVEHPVGRLVQAAFVAEDGLQCGYCTPGQIVSATACILEGAATSDEAIREAMSGNLCRCGAYPNIVAAVRSAAAVVERR
ncbi:(2Fe-2S)-binding protein [Aquibium sp. ELW1220]|uniref:(2Fe-2S)-binding protein n=1 Tax=Aquibium sp. ELW1220 TaxID=2976766 RepID=UPI0025B0107F|nr:(2Fe-2S)-binding protein [Aquibium sp. ELW1220]MDN2583433.1 (2Fe-2S)-binding protein [Aquibium sp. ELW1220]